MPRRGFTFFALWQSLCCRTLYRARCMLFLSRSPSVIQHALWQSLCFRTLYRARCLLFFWGVVSPPLDREGGLKAVWGYYDPPYCSVLKAFCSSNLIYNLHLHCRICTKLCFYVSFSVLT